MTNEATTRFPRITYVVLLVLIIVVAGFPVLSVYLTSLIADAYGCTVTEAGAQPCIVNGVDRGELLYFMGMMGWFMIVSIPFGILALCFWAVALIVHVIYRRRNN